MRSKGFVAIVLLFIVALLGSMLPGCAGTAGAVESYVAVAPRVLQAGGLESISVTLFSDTGLTSGTVEVALLKDGGEVTSASARIGGKGTIDLQIPEVEEGAYVIRIKGDGFEDSAQVSVESDSLIFLETDKPIYKPGQTVMIRALTLDPDLKPVSGAVTVEALDAKGIKIFRTEVSTDDFGMVGVELPISQEPNLGVWKLIATSESGDTELDVRVEEYVLPKYEVSVDLPSEWFLVTDPIVGSVAAEYSFGKPVSGELVIKASRYVGEWEEYATLTKPIDGDTEFELPAVGYVAGVPAAGGLGNVMLEVTVVEDATGYEESSSEMVTVSSSALNIQIIPEGLVFKPNLAFGFLIITETPDNQPVDATVGVDITYLDKKLEELGTEKHVINVSGGKALLEASPPAKSVVMIVDGWEISPISSREPARATRVVEAGYSPSGSFIHVEQVSAGVARIGERVTFRVHSTKEATNFYYEVVSRDRVVFTDFTRGDEISFVTTPQMTPSARLLVYQILPNSEMAADYVPFKVVAEYPHDVTVAFSKDEGRPGEELTVNVETEGVSRVGIAAVDRSVFILAENRLNLQQVFAELERLYMAPRVELHEFSIFEGVEVRGAREIFEDAGVVVLSNNEIPEGEKFKTEGFDVAAGGRVILEARPPQMAADGSPVPIPAPVKDAEVLAEVERVRQYFPETWLWEVLDTGADGKGSLDVEVPDTITTWMLRAVAISPEKGLGVAETQLTAFQPFFLKADLPYSAIRGEEFPLKVAVYNYLDEPQSVHVQIEGAEWFDLLDAAEKTVDIAASEVGGVEFMIRPGKLGINEVKVTARSTEAADAVIKTLIVEPEGIAREFVENLTLSAGSDESASTMIPALVVADSGRAYVTVTSSYLTQTLDGLEGLIQMPFGCGEQNMIVFAPDVFITKYLEESGQLKPEIMAKAEKLMITGYQRELTYRHSDGSFSAFGESDGEGSLWLTAFVLKSFAQAEGLIYIDDMILDEAAEWIISHQNADGSFDVVGFVHHAEMMGGVSGKNALTAYVATALLEAGERAAAGRAIDYLEGELDAIEDAYTTALVTHSLELAGSERADDAYAKLMGLAEEDENGLHWGDVMEPEPLPQHGDAAEPMMFRGPMPGMPIRSVAIEATGYAAMALTAHGDALNASRAAKWLVSQRNAYGGYGSTQDTVVALQALTEFASGARADVDLRISVEAGGEVSELKVTQENFDVLQVVQVPVNADVEIRVEGRGEAIAQVVTRYNVPAEDEGEEILRVRVDYDATRVEVNDLVEVSVELEFAPPIEMEAGMVVLDVSVPTGFAAVTESVAAVVDAEEKMKRYDISGRKVIFYIENMLPGDVVSFAFDVRALYPVKAKGVVSEAYSYYKPEIRGETLGEAVVVR